MVRRKLYIETDLYNRISMLAYTNQTNFEFEVRSALFAFLAEFASAKSVLLEAPKLLGRSPQMPEPTTEKVEKVVNLDPNYIAAMERFAAESGELLIEVYNEAIESYLAKLRQRRPLKKRPENPK